GARLRMIARRRLLAGAGALALGALAGRAGASVRPFYGGHARLTLPIDTSRIDPHEPSSLSARLVGASLFDCLYAKTNADVPYPTLATALPARRGTSWSIELRPGLRSARGVRLDAKAVAASLERSRQRSPLLASVTRIRAVGPLT